MDKYRLAKKEAKKAVSKAHSIAFEEFYKELGTKSGEQKIYRIAKIKERKSRDLDQVRCVKDEGGNVLVTDDNIKDRWKNYFYKLFNDIDETLNYKLDNLEISERNINFTSNHNIRFSNVKEALRK